MDSAQQSKPVYWLKFDTTCDKTTQQEILNAANIKNGWATKRGCSFQALGDSHTNTTSTTNTTNTTNTDSSKVCSAVIHLWPSQRIAETFGEEFRHFSVTSFELLCNQIYFNAENMKGVANWPGTHQQYINYLAMLFSTCSTSMLTSLIASPASATS